MIKYIKRHPIEKVLDSRNKLITWTYMLNCYIHRKFDYKVPDFEELYTEIETMRASCQLICLFLARHLIGKLW